MLVTPEMTTEGGAPLSRLADILDEDEVGIKAEVTPVGDVRMEVDSTSSQGKPVHLSPDDAEALGQLLIMRAREARGVR